MSHHIETEHDKSTPIAGTDFLIYTVCFETPDDTHKHSSNTATSKVTSTKRHSDIGEISRMRARERQEPEKERSPSSSSASESSNDEVELVTTTMLEPQESDDSPEETGKLNCLFCQEKVSAYFSLKRHLKNVHLIEDPKVLKIIQKCHLLPKTVRTKNPNQKAKKIGYFLCQCNSLCDEKFRHEYNPEMNDHDADWYQTKIFSLKDLPSYIIAQVKTLETTSDPTKSPNKA